MTLTRFAVLALVSVAVVLAQDPVKIEEVEVLPGEARITHRVVFLVDVSGSMKGNRIERAVAKVLEIAELGGDQLEVAVLAFGSSVRRWSPEDQKGVPAGWAGLPSKEILSKINEWLTGLGAGDPETKITDALTQALELPRDELSIVIVSDGVLDDELQAMTALQIEQQKRENAGHGRAVVACYGIEDERAELKNLAAAGGGGYWFERYVSR